MPMQMIFPCFGLISGAVLNKQKTVAVMIGNINLTMDTEWLTIENFVNILGVRYGDNIRQAQKLNWQAVLNGLRTRLWLHHPRKLNLIQKIILLNTYINSKVWYMASNIALTKGFINKIRAEIGKFVWHGQTLQRIAFSNLILPKNRGGLNLHCPETKSKALLLNRMIILMHQLPFLSSFLDNPNDPIPPMFNHIIRLREELPRLPDQLKDNPSSQGIYHHLLAQKPDPGFVSAIQRNWKAIFKILHCNTLNSSQRANWYTIMNKKIKHRELLFQRGAVDDEVCEICPGEPESVVHKLFRCQRVRDIWRYQRSLILRCEPSLRRLEPEDFIYPVLHNISRNSREYIIKSLGNYFSYVIETPENNLGLDSFMFHNTVNNI